MSGPQPHWMTRPSRLLLLVLPLAIGLAVQSNGRAQTAPGGRFAFADTTLLRDTLGLTFGGLFPLADSLGLTPDTLRALSIRYRYGLARLVVLSDSMHVPVDSVGVILLRERYNPLASHGERLNALTYTSSYNTAQTSSTWNNSTDWSFARGPLFVHNNTDITLDRFTAGGQISVRQQRASVTEGGWKFSNATSVGGRANLSRFNSDQDHETLNEFQFSSRSQQKPTRNLSSDLSFFAGVLDLTNTREVKRGLSADFNGQSRYARGSWLVHDVRAHLGGNVSRTRPPAQVVLVTTHDLSNSVDGTLGVLPNAPVGLNVTYGLHRNRTETPLALNFDRALQLDSVVVDSSQHRWRVPRSANIDTAIVQQLRIDNDRASATLRLRQTSDRVLTLSERLGRSTNVTASNLSSLNTGSDQAFDASGRWDPFGSYLDVSFDNAYSNSRFPKRTPTGGYGIKSSSRQVNSTLTRNLGRRVTFKATGLVSLGQYRYYSIGQYSGLPADRDDYRQSYRIETQYNRSERMTTGIAFEVIQQATINLSSQSSGANSRTHTYRGEWRWNYRLLPGLTATQSNRISADYTYGAVSTSNQLSLIYDEITTLNAVLSPRTSLEITHSAKTNPTGNFTLQPDGYTYFSKGDESRDYTLRTRVTFQPSPLLALDVSTEYLNSGRVTVTDTGNVPQRRSRTLNVAGGGTLNVPLGNRGGRLTGDLRRVYNGNGSLQFQNGVEQPSTASHLDYWTGRLELTWIP